MEQIKKSHQTLLAEEENCPSGTVTPVFPWSPLPQRRQLGFTENSRNDIDQGTSKVPDGTEYYPKCDVSIWLRSCDEEITIPIKGKIKGTIPEWLNGSLLRNGPGSLKVGDEQFQHLFDSSALLHRFGIRNGEVTYQCRFLQSEIFKKNWAAKRIVITEFGTKAVPDPCHSIFQRVAAIFDPKSGQSDNAMISIYPFGDEMYAFNEIPVIHKINSETLETEGQVDVSDHVNIIHHTSHPHVTKDGSVYNLGLSVFATGPHHTIVHFPAKKMPEHPESMFEQARIVGSVRVRWPLHPSYMHTFGITENYFIVVEQPLTVSIPEMLGNKFKNEPMAGCLKWYHEEYTRISLISRKTGNVAYTFFAEAFFYLHIINQYETSDYVVLDICSYRDPSMLDCMYIETMKSMQQNPDYAKMFRGRPVRFILPLKPAKVDLKTNLIKMKNTKAKEHFLLTGEILVKPEKICDLGCETPRINCETNLGKTYRYFYAISSDVDADNPGTIIKVDVRTKQYKTWCEDNCYPSEPIFVPSPNSQSEDDGVVLAAMIWGGQDTNRVGLLVLNGISFEEIGRAEFMTPGPVPKCLHGWFVPKK